MFPSTSDTCAMDEVEFGTAGAMLVDDWQASTPLNRPVAWRLRNGRS